MAYDGMFVPRDEDPRSGPEPEGELATYRQYLRDHRLTLELKCRDLTPEQLATRSVPPSELSLLGLVRHLAFVEHTWFQRALQGETAEPRPFKEPDDWDADFGGARGTPECAAEAFAEWRRQIVRADAWLDTLTDDRLGEQVVYNRDGAVTAVRSILVHMIEEYARHCGHADLLRECLDGRTGE